MSEDLALHEILGDGAAIDGDEGLAATAGAGVQRLGAEFLAGAALAGDEHGSAGGRNALDLLEHRPHRRGLADKALEGRRGRRRRGRCRRRRLVPLRDRRRQPLEQGGRAIGLRQIVDRAGLDGGDGGIDGTARAGGDHADRLAPEGGQSLDAAERLEIGENDGARALADGAERFVAARDALGRTGQPFERAGMRRRDAPLHRIGIDNENLDGPFRAADEPHIRKTPLPRGKCLHRDGDRLG